MNNHKKIEKSWAVYGWFHGPWGIGKVTDEYSNTYTKNKKIDLDQLNH